MDAALDENEEARIRTYSTADHAEQAAVFGVMHKLLCVAQSHRAGGGDERALGRQLRQLRQEAAGLLTRAPAAALQAL